MNKFYITGSSSGLGKALVDILLLNESNHITGISRTNNLQHPRFTHYPIDLSDLPGLSRQAESIWITNENIKRIYLINNAGFLGPVKYMGEMNDEELTRIYHVNLVAPAILSNAFIRQYRDFEGEKIILNISSGASRKPYDGWSGYCSSKAALDMMSRVIAVENEIRGYGFKILALAPGIIDTAMQHQLRNTSGENFSRKEKFVKLKEEKQLLSADQAAQNIIRFLENTELHKEVVQDIRQI
jgi:benzil reductase ((S)-benzoin forming)